MGSFEVQSGNGGNSTTSPYPIIGFGEIYSGLMRVARPLNIKEIPKLLGFSNQGGFE